MEYWKVRLTHPFLSKAEREEALKEIRKIAAEIGEEVPPYNSPEFSVWLRKI